MSMCDFKATDGARCEATTTLLVRYWVGRTMLTDRACDEHGPAIAASHPGGVVEPLVT